MQRLVNDVYGSRSFKIVSYSVTRGVSSEAFLATKYSYSRFLNVACVINVYVKRKHILTTILKC